MSRTVTVAEIMALGPCSDYPVEVVTALWAGREALTIAEVAALPISASDRFWALSGLLPARAQRLLACDIAGVALARHWNSDDTRPADAIAAARRHADGLATAAELAAAWAAARDAGRSAARDARAASWAASRAAARAAEAASWAASWAAARAAEAAAGAAEAAARDAGAAAWDAAWAEWLAMAVAAHAATGGAA